MVAGVMGFSQSGNPTPTKEDQHQHDDGQDHQDEDEWVHPSDGGKQESPAP